MLFKVLCQLFVDDGVHQRTDIGIAELLLGLAFKLRLRKLHGDNRRNALAHIFAGDFIFSLDDVVLLAIGVDDSGERGLEAGLMHTAFRSMDVVCERD